MDCDIAIIGGGVIGLAIASSLADRKSNIYIVEKNDSHGRGISSRNSEVIHAGIYYPTGSLKAELCIEGRQLLYEICAENKIPHLKIGKLIIATSEEEMATIEHLWMNAKKNGISSVSLVAQGKIAEMEPHIRAFGAVFSPDTGIINAHALMDYYLCDARSKGADIVYGTEVVGIDKISGGYRIATVNRNGECFDFDSERVVNAAGLHADRIAGMVGKNYVQHFCKGDYFSINNVKKGIVQKLIYPVPEKNHAGLGVHLTLDLQGRMKLGPDATYIDRVENYMVDASKKERFYEAAVKFLPFIHKEDIVPDMSGIRPKLQAAGEDFHDFVIREDLPGFVNLVGIESPGLTAAPAIARCVRDVLAARSVLA